MASPAKKQKVETQDAMLNNTEWNAIEAHVDSTWQPLPAIDSKPINKFLLDNDLHIKGNPCISPDFCLSWATLKVEFEAKSCSEVVEGFEHSAFNTGAEAEWRLAERKDTGDHVWLLQKDAPEASYAEMEDKVATTGSVCGLEVGFAFPASFNNLLVLKNLILSHDDKATIFPTATGTLGQKSLGLGARMTALHYPATEWAMAQLELSMTGNQNSIPRELIYDVNEMLDAKLDQIAFPFIGSNIPEGHQGTSVEGMSHCSVLSKLKNGFHKHQLPWGFNADHQPIGGKYDIREDQLVRGCVLASYITYDISHELEITPYKLDAADADPAALAEYVNSNIPAALREEVKQKIADAGVSTDDAEFNKLLAYVWPAMKKMKLRDAKYKKARAVLFKDAKGIGKKIFREMSIDELPGITAQNTLATILALCQAMDMPVQYVAPAFGFQKNCQYDDNEKLEALIQKAWVVCKHFNVSIGFHSGSGKSAKNYEICGKVTESNLEVKTSGRYTYECGRALYTSSNPQDQEFWKKWYEFTVQLALGSAFQDTNAKEQEMARTFIVASVPEVMEKQSEMNDEDDQAKKATLGAALDTLKKQKADEFFKSREECEKLIHSMDPHPDHMLWFEYNFLYVLAKEGKAEKQALGNHTPAGFAQRGQFYGHISDEGQLNFAKNIALYIIFLARTTGQATSEKCDAAEGKLKGYAEYQNLLDDIKPC